MGSVASRVDSAPVTRGAVPGQPGSSRGFVLGVCVAVLVLRCPGLLQPLRFDEAGYLLVAQQWHLSGDHLYGDYFVDRPPLLLAVFKVATMVEWDQMIRLVAMPFAVAFVVAAAWSGYLLAGASAARWSALVGGALVSTPAVAADQADGELLAIPFVMTAVAATLAAFRQRSGIGTFWLAGTAGLLATAAVLVKQSFVDAFVFGSALLLAAVLQHRVSWRRAIALAACGALGVVVAVGGVLVYLGLTGHAAERLWVDLFAVRLTALDVVWGASPRMTILRALLLLALGLVSGMLPLLVRVARGLGDGRRRGAPEIWAVGATLAFALASLALGGSYWPHYLLQLAPMVSLAAGWLAVGGSTEGASMRRWGLLTAASSVAVTLVVALVYASVPQVSAAQRIGEWVGESSRRGDTAFVSYGNATTLYYTGLASPYHHLWSVPMRVGDPHLEQLEGVLAGPRAPTWIVEWNSFNSWRLDADSSMRDVVATRYRIAGEVCGRWVWLRRDTTRALAAAPSC